MGAVFWDEVLAIEPDADKGQPALNCCRTFLGIEDYLIPAIGERLQQTEFDAVSGQASEKSFPYIRSHNVLNNPFKAPRKTSPP